MNRMCNHTLARQVLFYLMSRIFIYSFFLKREYSKPVVFNAYASSSMLQKRKMKIMDARHLKIPRGMFHDTENVSSENADCVVHSEQISHAQQPGYLIVTTAFSESEQHRWAIGNVQILTKK